MFKKRTEWLTLLLACVKDSYECKFLDKVGNKENRNQSVAGVAKCKVVRNTTSDF